MGTPVAPLYKALRESGLGESVISDGLETVLQQVVPVKHEILLFSVSLTPEDFLGLRSVREIFANVLAYKQATYSVGLKGISDSSKCADIEKIITETLIKVSECGFV